jgi:hypothetical protein
MKLWKKYSSKEKDNENKRFKNETLNYLLCPSAAENILYKKQGEPKA